MVPFSSLTFGPAARAALVGLDSVDLEDLFLTEACMMKCPPAFLRAFYRASMRFALSEENRARDVMPSPSGLDALFFSLFIAPPPSTWWQRAKVPAPGTFL